MLYQAPTVRCRTRKTVDLRNPTANLGRCGSENLTINLQLNTHRTLHEHNSATDLDSATGRRSTLLALQRGLGLLPERDWFGVVDHRDVRRERVVFNALRFRRR